MNLEAEESVLGAMMISPGAIAAVSEILDAGDFYRESHAKLSTAPRSTSTARTSRSTRSRSRTSSSQRGELDVVGGRVRLHELARPRPRHRQRPPLRASRPRERDAAWADPTLEARSPQLGWEREGEGRGARLPRRAARLRAGRSGARRASSSSSRTRSSRERSSGSATSNESGAEVTGLADRLQGARPDHGRPPALQPRDPRGAPFDGKVRLRARGRDACGDEGAEALSPSSRLEMSKQEVAQRLICSRGKVELQRDPHRPARA